MDLINVVKANNVQNVRDALKQDWDRTTLQRGIYFAINQGNLDIVKLILSAASSTVIEQSNDRDSTSPFVAHHHLADAVFQGHTEIVRLLIEKGASCHLQNEMTTDSDQQTILMLASQEGYFEIVKILVEAGANVNVTRQGNANALLSAASNGHQAIFDYLYPLTNPELWKEALEVLPAGLRMREFEDNADPLVCNLTSALYSGEFDLFQEVLLAGVDVNATDACGCTALFVATLKQCPKAVRLLLSVGADSNLGDAGDGRTPLMVISGEGWCPESSIVCTLLLEAGANVDVHDTDGQTPLMHTVLPLAWYDDARIAKQECVSLLLESGIDINARNIKSGQTALMQVLQSFSRNEVEQRDQKEVIVMLLKSGADISIPDYSGRIIIPKSDTPHDLEISEIVCP